MKVIVNGREEVILPNDVIGVCTMADHKSRTGTMILLSESATKKFGLGNSLLPIEKTYTNTLLALLTEQAQQNLEEKEVSVMEKLKQAIKKDFDDVMEWMKNAKK